MKKKYSNYPDFKGNKSDSFLNIKALNAYKKDTEESDFYRKNAHNNILVFTEAEKVLKKHFNKSDNSNPQLDSLCKKYQKSSDKGLFKNLRSRSFATGGL